MDLIKKYFKKDDSVILLYESFILIVLANLSFIVSYYIKFAGNIPEYNFKPYLFLAPFYSILTVFFNTYFKVLTFKSTAELIIKSVKSVLLITMCSIAAAYIFRNYMQGIPTSVFIIAAIINIVIFIEWIKFRGSKKR